MIGFQLQRKSDLLGAAASGLCMIHCMATPLIFISKACTATCCASAPLWWQLVDYLFLVISLVAIYYASKNSTNTYVKVGLYTSWVLLLGTILCERFLLGVVPASVVYIPALFIVILHIYNHKYCKCADDACCVN